MKTHSEKKEPAELPPILCRTYRATRKGFAAFSEEANTAHLAGYDFQGMSPLGSTSFGAVWKKVREDGLAPERDIFGTDDDLELI